MDKLTDGSASANGMHQLHDLILNIREDSESKHSFHGHHNMLDEHEALGLDELVRSGQTDFIFSFGNRQKLHLGALLLRGDRCYSERFNLL